MRSAKDHIKGEDWQEAKEQLTFELQQNPKNAKAYYWLGDIYRKKLQFDKMNAAFDSSLKYSSWHSHAIEVARKKATILMFIEGKRIALHPIIYHEDSDENRQFSKVFANYIYHKLKSIRFNKPTAFISTNEMIAMQEEAGIRPKIIYDTPSITYRWGDYAGKRKDKELEKMAKKY